MNCKSRTEYLRVLTDVFFALQAGQRRAECGECHTISEDPSVCPECGSLGLDEFTREVLDEGTLTDEMRDAAPCSVPGTVEYAALMAELGADVPGSMN